MKITKQALVLSTLLLLVTSLFLPPKANSSYTLGIFPPIITIRLKPGTTIRQPIRLYNSSDSLLYFRTQIKTFKKTTLFGQPLWPSISQPPKWVKIIGPIDNKLKAYPVKANSKQDFVAVISPPANTPLGDYYLSVIFLKYNPGQSPKTINFQPGIATNLLISVTAKLEEKLTPPVITKFTAPLLADSWQKEIKLDLAVYNPSHSWQEVVPNLRLEKHLGFGKDQTLINFIPVTILGGNERKILLTENQLELANSNHKVQAKTGNKKTPLQRIKEKFFSKEQKTSANNYILNSDSFKFGLYKLHFQLHTSSSQVEKTRFIIFFPWKATLLSSPFIVLSFLFLLKTKKHQDDKI